MNQKATPPLTKGRLGTIEENLKELELYGDPELRKVDHMQWRCTMYLAAKEAGHYTGSQGSGETALRATQECHRTLHQVIARVASESSR
jgi:hypothetical protein